MPRSPTATRKARDEIKKRLWRKRRAVEVPEGFLSRSELLLRVGITEGQLRSILAMKIVTNDTQNAEGRAMYSEKTAEKLSAMKADGSLFRLMSRAAAAVPTDAAFLGPSTYSPEQGVRVFEMLSEGRSLEHIILELGRDDRLRIHPAVAKRIQSDYLDISTAILLPSVVVDQINKLPGLPGSFPLRDAHGVFNVLEACVAARLCANCMERFPDTWCITCINDDAMVQQRRASELAHPPPYANGAGRAHVNGAANGAGRPHVNGAGNGAGRSHVNGATNGAGHSRPNGDVRRPAATVDADGLPPIDGLVDGKVPAPPLRDHQLPDVGAPAPLPPELLLPPEDD